MRVVCLSTLLVGMIAGLTPGHGVLAAPAGYERDVRAFNLAHGRVVFTNECKGCHSEGRDGAPVPGDLDDWVPRLEQPLATLIEQAIDGHNKLAVTDHRTLVDQDVAAAVAYLTHHARQRVGDINLLPPTGAGPETNCIAGSAISPCPPAVPPTAKAGIVNMLLWLTGKDRWR